MAGCGYVCPVCEGKGFLENLEPCDFCTRKVEEIQTEDWLKSVHEGPCCGDWDVKDENSVINRAKDE